MTDLNELLGIDPDDPLQQHADRLVAARHGLIPDLVAVRRSKGLTRKEVARRTGWPRSGVADFERGSDPYLSSLTRYALAVGAELDFVITAIESPAGEDE